MTMSARRSSSKSGARKPDSPRMHHSTKDKTGSAQNTDTDKGSGKECHQVIKITAVTGGGKETQVEVCYYDVKVVGNGSFGVVYRAKLTDTNEPIAIKKVLQDKKFKNRELQIMRRLRHPNIVDLKYVFYTYGDKQKDDLYLNLILEYIPETVYRVLRHFTKNKQALPHFYIKLYIYQLCRSLAYLHSLGICHRDIKPQNLLCNPETGVLKLCDFGSAKQLIQGEPNVAYICSRYYRAPELIFGATDYSTKIDIWSTGCVMAELITGQPIFPGSSSLDQLVEIIKILGMPTREQIFEMNPHYREFKFPQVKVQSWVKTFGSRGTPDAIDLINQMLTYVPTKRVAPLDACVHSYFDELREPNTRFSRTQELPPLFNFTEAELAIKPTLNSKLVPARTSPVNK